MLVTLIMRYARKVMFAFIVSTISRRRIKPPTDRSLLLNRYDQRFSPFVRITSLYQ